jgi:5-methylcytosine-specific restriction protein A
MPRRNFSASVKKAAHARANGRCEKCGQPTGPHNPPEVDHIREDWETGEPTLENAQVLGKKCCHAPKSAAATERRSNADRMKRKHEGTWPKTKHPLRSRGFDRRDADPDT